MKIIAKKQLIAIALMGSMSQVAIANTANCEENYGPWCDITSFLTQQEPTAAGPGLGDANFSDINRVGFTAESFGGNLIDNEEDNGILFLGYGLLQSYGGESETSEVATITAVRNPDTNTFTVRASFGTGENAQTIDLNLDESNRYTGNIANTLKWEENKLIVNGNEDYDFIGAMSSEETEGPKGMVVLTNISGGKYNPNNNKLKLWTEEEANTGYVAIGDINQRILGAIGKPTALSVMNTIEGTTDFRLNGIYTRQFNDKPINSGNFTAKMTVDFTNETWHTGNMFGLIKVNEAAGKIEGNTFFTETTQNFTVLNPEIESTVIKDISTEKNTNSFRKVVTTKIRNVAEGTKIEGVFTGSNAQNLVGYAKVNIAQNVTKEITKGSMQPSVPLPGITSPQVAINLNQDTPATPPTVTNTFVPNSGKPKIVTKENTIKVNAAFEGTSNGKTVLPLVQQVVSQPL